MRPDHRIYVTTGSHLMMEHPACDDLLERLDEILYRAAFHDGDPFRRHDTKVENLSDF